MINISQTSPFHPFSPTTINGMDDTTLTISPFTFNEEGSYVCRTENIAGEDADVVSLTAGKLRDQQVA